MGGQAFKGYATPRLNKEQYSRLHCLAHGKLLPLFIGIATPPLDPDKQTLGDIDFIVHTPLGTSSAEVVGTALGAIDKIIAKPTSNYAVPFDGAYAQIDVHMCNEEEWELQVFLHSYGRLGQF